MTFQEVIEKLRDGKAYIFTNANLAGYFYKAPHPEDHKQTNIDGAVSAITYYDKITNAKASPTLMLYDFDDDETGWVINRAFKHPLV